MRKQITMYFVAYFIKPKIHVIIPMKWVKDIGAHWEKFVNNSLNRSQTFLAFYSENPLAMIEGRPNVDYIPDFDIETNIQFPADGCYLAKLLCFKGEYFEYKYKETLCTREMRFYMKLNIRL